MLAVTGGGDDGTTGLLGGGRARKDDPRIEAFGAVDEASSAIGLAKGLTADDRVRELCEELQRGLYRLGAQLATEARALVRIGDRYHDQCAECCLTHMRRLRHCREQSRTGADLRPLVKDVVRDLEHRERRDARR